MKTTKAAYLAMTLSIFMLIIVALGNQGPGTYQNLVTPAAADDTVGNNSVGTAVVVDVASLGFRWYSGTDAFPGPGGTHQMELDGNADDFFKFPTEVPKEFKESFAKFFEFFKFFAESRFDWVFLLSEHPISFIYNISFIQFYFYQHVQGNSFIYFFGKISRKASIFHTQVIITISLNKD